ncbi:hypothetical protein ABC795_08695 [Blastococcus sp. HT6-30]|uniref:hypothetical protein n=1 Tax=Blastococcus sp. HT6-30 TaxID=3144843 RepID=UPI00321B8518
MTYTLVRRSRAHLLDLDTFAARARLHPDLVRRLVALGLLEAERDRGDVYWLNPGELATVARIQRLRAGFSLTTPPSDWSWTCSIASMPWRQPCDGNRPGR